MSLFHHAFPLFTIIAVIENNGEVNDAHGTHDAEQQAQGQNGLNLAYPLLLGILLDLRFFFHLFFLFNQLTQLYLLFAIFVGSFGIYFAIQVDLFKFFDLFGGDRRVVFVGS